MTPLISDDVTVNLFRCWKQTFWKSSGHKTSHENFTSVF